MVVVVVVVVVVEVAFDIHPSQLWRDVEKVAELHPSGVHVYWGHFIPAKELSLGGLTSDWGV